MLVADYKGIDLIACGQIVIVTLTRTPVRTPETAIDTAVYNGWLPANCYVAVGTNRL
jgi:hypothetical protein